jgi:hypothetical protein
MNLISLLAVREFKTKKLCWLARETYGSSKLQLALRRQGIKLDRTVYVAPETPRCLVRGSSSWAHAPRSITSDREMDELYLVIVIKLKAINSCIRWIDSRCS